MPEENARDRFSEMFASSRERLIKGVAGALGGHALDSVNLGRDEEVARWMQPTSDAARIAFEKGGTLEDAIAANELSANQMWGEQQQIRQQMQGAPPEQINAALQQANLTDDQIFQHHQKYGHALGKSNGQDDPKVEAAYHSKMAAKAWAKRQQPQMTYQDVTGQEVSDAAASA